MAYTFNANYGAIASAREFWGGNNGFVTIAAQLPAGTILPSTADYNTAKAAVLAGTASDADQVLVSNAERNLFKIAQAVGMRAVVVAVSSFKTLTAAETLDSLAAAASGTTAAAKAGVTATAASASNIVAVTFLIERADVFTANGVKPGSTYAADVKPAEELAANIQTAGFFESSVSAATQASGVLVLVFDALTAIL